MTALHTSPIQRFDFFALQDFAAPFVEEIKVPEIRKEIVEDAPPAPPPAPTFSEEELEAAKEEAYAEGLKAGKLEAEAAAQASGIAATKALASAAEEIATQMKESQAAMQAQIEQQQQALLICAKTMAEQLALSSLKENADNILRDMVQHCLPHLLREPSLTLTVAPDACERLDIIIAEAVKKTGFKGEYTIKSDETYLAGDIDIVWNNGSAGRRVASLLADIEEIINADMPAIMPQSLPNEHAEEASTVKGE